MLRRSLLLLFSCDRCDCLYVLANAIRALAQAEYLEAVQLLIKPDSQAAAAAKLASAAAEGHMRALALQAYFLIQPCNTGQGDNLRGTELMKRSAASGDALAVVLWCWCRVSEVEGAVRAARRRELDPAVRCVLPALERTAESTAADSFVCAFVAGLAHMGVLHQNMAAERFLRLSAHHSFAPAQFALGVMAENRSLPDAIKQYVLAASQGFAPAQAALALMHEQAIGMPRNTQEAVRLYRMAAEQEYAQGVANLGVMYEHGHASGVRDLGEAVRLYSRAMAQGHPAAYKFLGAMYQYGCGVQENHAEAARLYRISADMGHAPAQCGLGLMYEHGMAGLPKSYDIAVQLYRAAADQNYAPAVANLGVMYEHGFGVKKDYVEAVRQYRLASSMGNPAAHKFLGYMYHYGLGVQENKAEAARLYRQAIRLGYGAAQANLDLLNSEAGAQDAPPPQQQPQQQRQQQQQPPQQQQRDARRQQQAPTPQTPVARARALLAQHGPSLVWVFIAVLLSYLVSHR
jgi:TPR repeat protein